MPSIPNQPSNVDPNSLFVVHNLSVEKLEHAIELGGLAAPSLAVARRDVGFERFGQISLIGSPDMANPRNRGVRAFAADVYSPRQPQANFDIDKNQYRRMEELLKPAAKALGEDVDRVITPKSVSTEGLERILKEDVTRMAYLMEIGDAPRIRYEAPTRVDPRLSKFRSSRDKMLKNPAFESAVMEIITEFLNGKSPEIREKISGVMLEEQNGVLKPAHNTLADYANQIEKSRKPRRPDLYEMSKVIGKKINATKRRQISYKRWVKDSFSGVLKKSYFRTDHGQRKAYQLELLVREMTRSIRDSEGWQYGLASVRSVLVPEFRDLSQMKASRDGIVSEDNFETIKKDMDERFLALADKIAPYHGSGKGFEWCDICRDFIKELSQGKLDVWQREIFSTPLSEELVQDARDFAQDLRSMPSEYFEIKMQRSVALNEFTAALVPHDIPKEMASHLSAAGLQVVKYKYDREGNNRKAALDQVKDEVLFQRPVFTGKSQLLEAVEQARQAKATASDWKNITRKMVQKFPGVSNDEAEFIGLYDWLDQMGKETLTREDVSQYIEGNKIEIIEKVYSGEEPAENSYRLVIGMWIEPDDAYVSSLVDDFIDDARDQLVQEFDGDEDDMDIDEVEVRDRAWSIAYDFAKSDDYSATLVDQNGSGDEIDCTYNKGMGTVWIEDEYIRSQLRLGITDVLDETKACQAADEWAGEKARDDGFDGPANFGEYTEEGGKEYFELTLSVPNLHKVGVNARSPKHLAKMEEYGEQLSKLASEYRSIEGNPERELLLVQEIENVQTMMNQAQSKVPFVEDAHFEDENIIVHARVKIRHDVNGEPYAFIEEVQSDLSTAHREPPEPPEVSQERRHLQQGLSSLEKSVSEVAMKLIDQSGEDQLDMSLAGVKSALSHVEDGGSLLDYSGHQKEVRPLIEALLKPENEASRKNLKTELEAYGLIQYQLLTMGPAKVSDPTLPETPWKGRKAVELMVKHIIRFCSEKGCSGISWTTAAQQAARWDQAAEDVVNEINWQSSGGDLKTIALDMHRGGIFDIDVDRNGKIVWAQDQAERLTGKSLSKLLGPQVAAEVLSTHSGCLDGDKITFSDSGYSIVYDQQIRSIMNKLGKKYGVQTALNRDFPDFGAKYIDLKANLDTLSYDTIRERLISIHGEQMIIESEGFADQDLSRKREEFEGNIQSLENEIKLVRENPPSWASDIDDLIRKYQVKIDEYKTRLDRFEGDALKAKKAQLLRGLSPSQRQEQFPELRKKIPGEPVWGIPLPAEMKNDLCDKMTMFRKAAAQGEKVVQAQLDAILPDLEARLKKLNITGVDLSVAAGNENAGQVAFKANGDISILISNSLDSMHTLNHEVVHVLKRRNLFTELEWDALEEEAEKNWISRYNIEGRYHNFSRETQIEEAIAEAYAEREVGTKPKGIIVQAFMKIKKVIGAVKSVLSQHHITTPDQVFEKITSGEIGARFKDDPEEDESMAASAALA